MLSKRTGPILILLSAMLGSLFPIIGKLIGTTIPPLFFAGGSVLISTLPALLLLLHRRRDTLERIR
ncbi:MAG: hypothetical protein ACD_43C00110G0003, partial [uncultured bacterium]